MVWREERYSWRNEKKMGLDQVMYDKVMETLSRDD